MHDLVIARARICDGVGTPRFEGDVAVEGGRIRGVGSDLGRARALVDAEGLVLAPGIVDIHTHYDAQLTWDVTASPSPAVGVTSVVVGNCGFGIAPCRPADRDLTLRNLTRVEGIPLEALRGGVQWDFESFPEYLASLERRGVVPNVATFAGHSPIRAYVMGEDATRREATHTEIERMRELLRQALRCGAIGFGTSTLETHNGADGGPVASRFASLEEFRAFASVLAEESRGVFQITKGMSTDISFLEEIAQESGRPVQICPMLLDPGCPEVVFEEMDAISAAQSRGHTLYGQVSPFPEIMDFTLEQAFPMESMRAWRPAMQAGTGEALEKVYADIGFRRSVRAELATRGGPFRFSNQWSAMTVTAPGSEANRALVGRSVAAIAEERGVHPLDCMLDIGLAAHLKTGFNVAMFNGDEAEVTRLISHPHSVIGLGDAGAHLSFFCQAGTGLYLIQRFVREQGALTFEEAVRMLTSRPADVFGIRDRGRIAVGSHADLMLLDPDTAGLGPNRLVHDLPNGAARIDRAPLGVHGVWVNGERVVGRDGLLRDPPRAGEVLRSFDPHGSGRYP